MNPISRYIPFTKAYSDSLQAKVWGKMNRRRHKLYELSSLSDDEKDELYPKIKLRLKRLITIEEKFEKVSSFVFGLVYVPWIIYSQAVLPFQINNYYSSLDYSGWSCFYFILLFILCITVLLLGTVVLPFSLINLEHNKRREWILQGCYFFIIIALMYYFPYKNLGQEHSLLVNAIYAAMLSSALYLTGVVFILMVIMETLEFFLKTRRINKIPETKLIRDLLKLIELSEKEFLYRSPERKVKFMLLLEKSALLIEKKIPSLVQNSNCSF